MATTPREPPQPPRQPQQQQPPSGQDRQRQERERQERDERDEDERSKRSPEDQQKQREQDRQQREKQREARQEQRREDIKKAQEDAKNAPLGSPENPMRTLPVTAAQGALGTGLGGLTPAQRAGLAPLDPDRDAEEAADRFNRPNLQTTHEAMNALDPVSSAPSVGITNRTPLTGLQQGQAMTDMNGRPPMSLNTDDKEVFDKFKKALSEARSEDGKNGSRKSKDQQGFRTPMEMGIPGSVLSRILEMTDPDQENVERAVMPGGHYFPETGTRYRLR